MIEIDDKKKISREERDREIRLLINRHWTYTALLIIVVKFTDVKAIIFLDALIYVILSVRNLRKIDEIKEKRFK